jgi:phage/plasmid-associated DNA primase
MTIADYMKKNAYDNLEFCNGFDARIVKDPDAIVPYRLIDKSLKKVNKYFEITRPNKECCVFIDLDGKAHPNTTEEQFNTTNENIITILRGFENEFSVMSSSAFQHKTRDRKGGEIITNKYSFRITFHEYTDNILKMPKYVEEEKLPYIRDMIGGEIPIYYGKPDDKEYDFLDIDPSVYRGKGGEGVGKMRCPYAYKGARHQNNPINPFEVHRPNKIVSGDFEDNLINFIKPTYTKLNLGDDYLEPVHKPTKKVVKIKQEPTEEKNAEPTEQKTIYNTKTTFTIKKRPFNKEALKPSQMIDLLMNYLKNDKVDWTIYFKIGSTLAHNGYDYKVFDDWCKLSKDYNKTQDNCYDWNGWVESRENMSVGMIVNLLKNKPTEYEAYKEKYLKIPDPKITLKQTEILLDIVKYLRPFLYKFIRYTNKKWYVFNEHTTLWEVKPNIQSVVVGYIHKLCDNEIKTMEKTIKTMTINIQPDNDDDSDDEDDKKDENKKIKKIKKDLKKWESAKSKIEKGRNTLQTYCEVELLDNMFYEKLDRHMGFIAFEDCLYHIETGTDTPLSYDNYLTKTLPYPYQKGNEKDKTELREILKKICNYDEAFLEYYLSVLGYSLTGYAHKEQNFWVFYGSNGSNGKSKPFEILNKILGSYCVCGNTKMLQEGTNKEHKSIPSVASSYIAYFNELPKENKINNALVKNWRDGAEIQNEVMFGTEATIKINSKMFIITNHKLNFGKDGGMNRSLIQLEFKSRFEDNLEEEDYDNLYFKKDKDLNGKIELMKYSFLELLLEYGKKYLTEGKLVEQPAEVKEATNELIMKNDTFLEWLDSYFVFEPNRNVMLCEMTEKYMETTSTTFKYDDDVRKHILQEMRRIGRYQFDRLKKKGDLKRGAFKNIRFKTQNELIKSMGCVLNYDDEEEEMLL